MSFFKSKKFYVILAIVIVVGYLGVRQYQKSNQPPVYETAKVTRGDLKQTVEATGKIQSASDLSLRFETAGTLETVAVKEGDAVKAGQLLVALRAAELNAAVAQAKANLDQKIAGATDSEREYYRAAADSAAADLNKARSDYANSVATAQAAVDTAKNNLKLAEGGESSQIVSQAYEDAVALSQATLSKLDNALTQADNILGIDNAMANDSFESYLSLLDSTKIIIANNNYTLAKEAKVAARAAAGNLTTASPHSAIDAALNAEETALDKMNRLLLSVSDVLRATPPVGSLTQASLDAQKTTIETTRTTITTQYTSVITQKQSISDAKNSYTTYQIAYEKSLKDLEAAKIAADSAVQMKEAAYNQALANLDNKINPTREVDLAPLRAALAQAVANRDKTILRAPIDGVVTKIAKKKGEYISMTDIAVSMVSPRYEVDVDIPETDVAKLNIGDTVTLTLDAFGDDTKFSGKVTSIDPASTEVQDVVYYKVKVALDETDKEIKPGMTANVTVSTDFRQGVLQIPFRAVRSNGEKHVRVLENGQIREAMVKLGLRGDDGQVEILDGLKEGEEIVLSAQGQ